MALSFAYERSVIPVTMVTGFLSAGKSTLVQRWLEELPRNDTAVVVNERGDVGIDGELLAGGSTQSAARPRRSSRVHWLT